MSGDRTFHDCGEATTNRLRPTVNHQKTNRDGSYGPLSGRRAHGKGFGTRTFLVQHAVCLSKFRSERPRIVNERVRLTRIFAGQGVESRQLGNLNTNNEGTDRGSTQQEQESLASTPPGCFLKKKVMELGGAIAHRHDAACRERSQVLRVVILAPSLPWEDFWAGSTVRRHGSQFAAFPLLPPIVVDHLTPLMELHLLELVADNLHALHWHFKFPVA